MCANRREISTESIVCQGLLKKLEKSIILICSIENNLYFCIRILIARSVRLGVRTPGFHPGNRGSNPLRTTKDFRRKSFN